MANNGDSLPNFRYDVFISFRGEDTRYNFTGNLHAALLQKEINTFFDDKKLRRGEDISPALFEAIEESTIFIVVFSQDYASSTWCLRELARIHDCLTKKDKRKHYVFPIFYKVDPSDVRHQRNRYEEAMTLHENRFGKDSDEVKKWRSALSEVANLKGDHFREGYDYEHKFVKKIVKEVSDKLPPKPLPIGEHLIGLKSCIQELMSLLDISSDDNVRMLGIYGAGGIGKTALAKALYNEIAHQFEAASFLSDVREKSSKISGMEDLQKTLVSEMREKMEKELGSAWIGSHHIKRKLGHKKVLLVLDDVDELGQLEQLAGGCDWFGLGSRIIITTRDKNLLDNADQVERIYKVAVLNAKESLELLCWNAFKKSHPKIGYEDVSTRAVRYAMGLPLALKVVGSNLMGKSLAAWECALEEYERIPDKKIQSVLKVSYDSLGDQAKKVFLDMACFFKGERVEYVTKILDACDLGATLHVEVLIDKSLITIDHHGFLKMHDLVQDMGREIVRQDAPSLVGERSRLWFHEDVLEVLTENSGSNQIEGIMLDPPQREVVEWDGNAFEKMSKLRILIVKNTCFSSGPKYLPNHLRLLDWEEYPSMSFPPKFYPKKIVVFNLCKSQVTLEEPFKKFLCLTFMNFSHNESLTEVPDVSEVKNLIELRLDYCKNLIKVHESVGLLKKLVHLSASNCTKLRTFLPRMFLPSLETLDLNLCVRLEHFPDIVEKMKDKPLKVYMINTAIKELPDSIGNLVGLERMEMPSSKRLTDLPSSLFMLPNFVAFEIGGCSQLRESFRRFLQISHSEATGGRAALTTLHFRNGGLTDKDLHAILKCFPNLKELNASENNFVSIPACIKECVCLTSLDVSVCRKLRRIPECTKLKVLDVSHCVNLEEISELPSTIEKVEARYCSSLTRETLAMLWSQVSKEIYKLEIVMPQTEIPEWFHCSGKEGTPRFWVRGKFPIFALALVLENVSGMGKRSRPTRRLLIDLHLYINGQCVQRKGYYNFSIEEDHVLICDLRVMFTTKEWQGLDAFLQHDWNDVQVSYEAPSGLTLSSWGVYVYKEHSRMEDVAFMCPDPKFSNTSIETSTLVPTITDKQKQIRMIESLGLEQLFDGMLMESMNIEEQNNFADKDFAINAHHDLMGSLKQISMQAKSLIESNQPLENPSGSGSGAGEEESALEGKHSDLLEWLLKTMEESGKKDQADGANKQEIFIHDGVALIKLKEPISMLGEPMAVEECGEASNSVSEEQPFDHQQQELLMDIFLNGMSEGLRLAKLIYPTLDVDTTIAAALSKGNRVSWKLSSGSEVENTNNGLPLPPLEMKTYAEGIINGLLEAQLSFPGLNINATVNAALSRAYEGTSATKALHLTMQQNMVQDQKLKGKAPLALEASSSRHEGVSSDSKVQLLDHEQQEQLMRICLDGMSQGLRVAKLSFPTLDIDSTIAATLSKCNQVSWARLDVQNSDGLPPAKMKAYMEGMLNGLFEAQLSFPTLDINSTMNAALSRTHGGPTSTKEPMFFWTYQPSMSMNMALEKVKGKTPLVREDGSSEEVQGWEPQYWKILLDGMIHGLRKAKLSFPTLDIESIMNTALSKDIRVSWPPSEEEKIKYNVPPLQLNLHIQGMNIGLHEARLTFPTLDILTIIYDALNMGGGDNVNETPMFQGGGDSTTDEASTSGYVGGSLALEEEDDNPLLQSLMMMGLECKLYKKFKTEHQALRKKFEKFNNEAAHVLEKDTPNVPSLKNQYDELLEKFNTLSAEFISLKHKMDRLGKEDNLHKDVAEHEKLGAIWKGRAEELQRLYDVRIEGLRKSEELEDLMNAIYLDGLRDGLLEAQVTIFALDMERLTAAHYEENEEHGEAAENQNSEGKTANSATADPPTAPKVDNPPDTSPPNPDEFANFEDIAPFMF